MNTLRLLLATCACALAFAADRKPNILVIVSDDQGYADVGFNGGKAVPTPHLDALAASGVRCTSGYVSHPLLFAHARRPAHGPLPTTLRARE